MTNWRWGKPLSFAEADALARRWAEGDVISEPERYRRLQKWLEEHLPKEIDKHRFAGVNEMAAYMQEQGLQEYTGEVDPTFLKHAMCEEECSREIIGLQLKQGPDMDAAFWTCMHQCSDVIDTSTLDPTSPVYPHSPENPEEYTTTFFLPEKVPTRLRKMIGGKKDGS
jgi:hypothetical protein